VAEGCRIRELPDGSREFVLDDPALASIQIDRQSTLNFGRTEVVIGSPFVLERDGLVHHLSPLRPAGLGPLVALYPGSARWLWTSAEGALTVVFDDGARLTVPPHPVDPAWSVGNVVARSGPEPPA